MTTHIEYLSNHFKSFCVGSSLVQCALTKKKPKKNQVAVGKRNDFVGPQNENMKRVGNNYDGTGKSRRATVTKRLGHARKWITASRSTIFDYAHYYASH